MNISERIGRSFIKEQYIFFNRPTASGVELFTIMNVHLKPKKAFVQLLAMRYVIEDFILSHPQYFNIASSSLTEALDQNVINATVENKPSLKTEHPILIVGDFNADCDTMSVKRQELIRLV